MKKIFHLSTCSTCQRIIKEIKDVDRFDLIDIKAEGISAEYLEIMEEMHGDIKGLFSKRAMKYRSLGLNEVDLTDADMRKWITEEYTFLKRPVIIYDDKIFVGNSKKVVASMVEYVNQ